MDLNLPGSGRTVVQKFSVFDYDTGKYRYFDAPIAALPLTGHYRAPRSRTPEGLAAPLPANASPAGEGSEPKGVIATLGGFGEAPPDTSSGQRLFFVALGLFSAWFLLNQYAKETAPVRGRR